jgi:hypothetical protein
MNPYRDIEADAVTYAPPFAVCRWCRKTFVNTTGMAPLYCGRCREGDERLEAKKRAAALAAVKPKPVVIERGDELSIMPYRPYSAHDVDAAQERPASLAEVAGRVTLTGAVVLLAMPAALVMLSAVAVGFAAWLLIPHRDREALAS